MATTFGLLLRSSLDGNKQARSPRFGYSLRHATKLNGGRPQGLEARSELYELFPMSAGDLPHTLEEPPAPRPAVRWTRYGYWNEGATAVYNERGVLIYGTQAR